MLSRYKVICPFFAPKYGIFTNKVMPKIPLFLRKISAKVVISLDFRTILSESADSLTKSV